MSLEEEKKIVEEAIERYRHEIALLEAKKSQMSSQIEQIREREAIFSKIHNVLKQSQARYDELLSQYKLKPAEGREIKIGSISTLKKLSGILSCELEQKNKQREAVRANAAGKGAMTRLRFEVYGRLKMDPTTKDPAMLALFADEMKKELEPYEEEKRVTEELDARIRECTGNRNFLLNIQGKLDWLQANNQNRAAWWRTRMDFNDLKSALDSRHAKLGDLQKAYKKIQARLQAKKEETQKQHWINKNKSVKMTGGDVTGSLRNAVDTGPG